MRRDAGAGGATPGNGGSISVRIEPGPIGGGGGGGGRFDALAGRWNWVAGQTLEIAADGSFKVFEGNRQINSGMATVEGGRYVLRHANGGWVDTVTLSADGKLLSGTNNAGANVSGTRMAN